MGAVTELKSAYHPWVDNYPEGIDWHAEIDITPVAERVLDVCARYPDLIAMDFMGRQTDYREFGRMIEKLSAALQTQLGVSKGTRIALLLPNIPYYAFFYYAVLRAGGVVVNCSPLYSIDELTQIIANAHADIIVTLDLAQLFKKAEQVAITTGLSRIVLCPFAKALPFPQSLLFPLVRRREQARVSASTVADRVIPYSRLMRSGGSFVPVPIDTAHDIAVQQYTGGTTGVPKGAMLTHANISANVSQTKLWALDAYRPKRKVIAVIPFFHVFSMTACLNNALVNAMEIDMLPRYELKGTLDLIKRVQPDMIMAVPTLVHAVFGSERAKKMDLSSFELGISGGAPLPQSVREEFVNTTGGTLVEGYGLTECAPVVCCGPIRAPAKDGSIGQPLPGTDIRFCDVDEPDKEVAPGERGEIQVRGPQVMAGYFEDPAATRDSFIDGWLRTGDVGLMDEQGHVFLVDRIKDLIISSGFNVYPRAIEAVLESHPEVDECNVIGVIDDYRGEAPVAFVKLVKDSRVTDKELKSFLVGKISRVEMPREIFFRDELPKTLVGKLSKKELRADYARMKDQSGGSS
ncbi:MAG: long-chain fatty acid--CoA ligase [Alphaproteobacteria bacterium]|nr:long-chain fatty acid--CoA ligase [Alphaproteobacteria bacterium]